MRQYLEDYSEIRDALKKNPDDPLALRAVGQQNLKKGRYKQAKNHYIQAVNLSPRLASEILLDYERIIDKFPNKVGPRFSLAGFEINQGDLDSALLELEETLDIDPANVEAYNVLGRIYVKQGRIDEVIELLERSMKQGIRDVSLTEILASAYLEKGRLREAAKFFNEILKHKPGDKQTLRMLGELYTRLEDYNDAAKSFQAMFSDDPEVAREVIDRLEGLLRKQEGSVLIREILADIYMRSIKPEAAVTKLKEIMRLDNQKVEEVIVKLKNILKSYPNHPETTLSLAEAFRRQGSYSEAIENYFNLAKGKPDLLERAVKGYCEVLEVCPQQVLARTYLADAYLSQHKMTEALSEFEQMLDADPETAAAIITKCREIIKAQPQLLQARLVLGRAYLKSGDIQRAAVEAEGIISIDKKFTDAYLLLGEAYFRLNLSRKAVATLSQALLMDPYNVRIQKRFREVKEKELDQEVKKIKERLNEDPWRMSLHLDLAKVYLQKDLKQEAVRELQLAVKDQARAPFAINLLGCIHRGEGSFDQAAAQFNRALEMAPSELDDFRRNVRFNIATTYEAQGQVSKALKLYEQILQEDIDFGDLERRVKYLKATSLRSMQAKALLMVAAEPGSQDVVVIWGREGKSKKNSRREEMSLSFGQTHNVAGYDFFMKGMHKAALEEFQLAVQLDAKFATALNNYAVALVREGKLYDAKSNLEDAVHIDPGSVVLRNNLGLVYSLLGQKAQAEQELAKAYTLDPELTGVCLNFGDICYAKNDIRRAIDLYTRAANFDVLAEVAEKRLRFKTPQTKSE